MDLGTTKSSEKRIADESGEMAKKPNILRNDAHIKMTLREPFLFLAKPSYNAFHQAPGDLRILDFASAPFGRANRAYGSVRLTSSKRTVVI
jgi:hypothetical protein